MEAMKYWARVFSGWFLLIGGLAVVIYLLAGWLFLDGDNFWRFARLRYMIPAAALITAVVATVKTVIRLSSLRIKGRLEHNNDKLTKYSKSFLRW